MRVLLIDVNCKNSSTGKIVYDLYSGIRKNGDEAAICYGRGAKIKEENIYKFGLDVETYIHALLTRITGFTGCFSFFSTHRLLKYIKKFKPDVVHIHELHAYFVNIKPVVNYLKKNNIKTVWTFHCEFMYTGKCGHAYECKKYKQSCGKCPHLKEYPSSLFFDHTSSMLKSKKKMFEGWTNLTIVTPSKWLADRVKTSFLSDKNTVVTHNGINTDIFYPRDAQNLRGELEIEENTKIVLAVAPGIMSENKGGNWVLKLSETLQNQPIHFILIGADDVNIPHGGNTTILPRINNQDKLAQFYSLADCFVICSKRENFPTTCLEAQCCGTPICGFDVGGVKETALSSLKDNFVTYGDIEALKKLVNDIIVQKDKNIRQNAEKEFSINTMTHTYIKLYNI